MRKFFILLFSVLVITTVSSQNFEGILRYEFGFKSVDSLENKKNNFQNDSDSIMSVYFKENNFVKTFKKYKTTYSLYLHTDKLQYDFEDNSKYVLAYSPFYMIDSKNKFYTLQKDTITYEINGFKCVKKKFVYNSIEITVFQSYKYPASDLGVAFYSSSYFLPNIIKAEIGQSLVVKLEYKSNQNQYSIDLVELKEIQIPDAFFNIPALIQTKTQLKNNSFSPKFKGLKINDKNWKFNYPIL